MSKYTSKVDELFNSIGFFPTEYKEFLYNLDLSEQKDFIEELYKRITSEQYKFQQGDEAFGTKIFERNTEYRYSQEDLQEAKKMKETLSGETFLKAIGKDDECLFYKATYVFHQRKIWEIEFEKSEIERLYKSIVNRVEIKSSFDHLIDKTSVYRNLEFEFLELPKEVTETKLRQYLEKHEFKKVCFGDNDDYFNYFKRNTFKLFADTERPVMLDIPLTKTQKKHLAHKMYELFSLYEAQNKDYSDRDLSKWAYAQILFCNFSEFRINRGNQPTYESTLKNVYKQIR